LSVLISPKINPSVSFFPLSSTQIKDERLLKTLHEKAENYLKAINQVLSLYTEFELVKTKKYVHNSEDTFMSVSSLRDAPTSFRDLRTASFKQSEKLLPKITMYVVG